MTECAYPGWGAEVHDRSDHGQLVRQNGNIFSFDESLIYGHLPFEKPLTSHNLHFNRRGPSSSSSSASFRHICGTYRHICGQVQLSRSTSTRAHVTEVRLKTFIKEGKKAVQLQKLCNFRKPLTPHDAQVSCVAR